MPVALVVMGVAGCGKSTVGAALAAMLKRRYRDGDDFHPASNIARMARGEPLRDQDRWPWLDAVGKSVSPEVIVGCSALKRAYRDRIRTHAPLVCFIHLHGSRAVIEARMAARTGHFMPLSLLDSQFATLEPPEPDESAVTVDIDQPIDAIIAAIRMALPQEPSP